MTFTHSGCPVHDARSLVHSQRDEAERGQLSFVVAMILFPVMALIFLLNCMADYEPVSSPFTKIEVGLLRHRREVTPLAPAPSLAV